MPASLSDILATLNQLRDELPEIVARAKFTPKQIAILSGLSDISERLGVIQAGEFRAGNGIEPGHGFSGARLSYPGLTYNSVIFFLTALLNDTPHLGLSLDGDIAAGTDISAPATTSLRFFPIDETYNGEAMGAGDLLIGGGAAGKPNILWDASAGELKFRNGTTVMNKISGTSSLYSVGASVRDNSVTLPIGITTVSFDSPAIYDDANFWSASNPTRLTIPYTGEYSLAGLIQFGNASTTGDRACQLYVDGIVNDPFFDIKAAGADPTYMSFYVEKPFTAGQYLEFKMGQSSAAELSGTADVKIRKVR